MRPRVVVPMVLVVALGGLGVAWAVGARTPVAEVVPGVVQAHLIAKAVVVEADGVADVRPMASGRVLRVAVRVGDAVTKGQLLAEIESDEAQAEVKRGEAEHQALTASAASVAEGARSEERLAQEAEVKAAREDVALAEVHAERQHHLQDAGAGTANDLQDTDHALAVAKARLEAAEARLLLARSGGRASDVRSLRARAEAAEASVAEAKVILSRTRLTAPIAGVVLERRIDPGDTALAAGDAPPLFEIGDPTTTELRIEVEAESAKELTIGQAVSVMTRGGGAAPGHARIARLGGRMEARTIGRGDAKVQTDGQVRVAWAEWTDAPVPLLGTELDAVVELGQRQVSATVPRRAISVREGRALVRVPSLFWSREQPVRIGSADDQRVEVLGLSVGTRVMVPD